MGKEHQLEFTLGETVARGANLICLITCSSAASQSGLVLSTQAIGADVKSVGIAPTRRPYSIAAAMADTANSAAERLGVDITVGPEEVHNEELL